MFLFFAVCPENAEHFPWAEEENAGNFPQMRVAVSCGHLRSLALGGLLRSLAVTRVAAGSARPLAVTCGHSSGCKWLQVADSSKIKYRVTCSRRSLAVTCGHSSGCKWLQVADFSKIKYRAACVLNDNSDFDISNLNNKNNIDNMYDMIFDKDIVNIFNDEFHTI